MSIRVLLHRGILLTASFIAGWGSVEARDVEYWSYEKLNKRADLVAIVAADSTEKWGEAFDKKLLGVKLEGRLTTFEVKTVLKGHLGDTDKVVKLVHFVESEAEKTFVNGPSLAHFRTGAHRTNPSDNGDRENGVREQVEPPHYLLFLKARSDGRFEPVSGQADSASSVMLLKPELTPMETDNEGQQQLQK